MAAKPLAERALTHREQQFVLEYAVDFDGPAAARRVGYSDSGACAVAKRLLSDPRVARYADRLVERKREQTGVTELRVLNEMALLAFSNMGHYVASGYRDDADGEERLHFDASTFTNDQWAAVREIEITEDTLTGERTIKLKLYDKRQALSDVAKCLGMHRNVIELTGKNGGPVKTINVNMTPAEAADAFHAMLQSNAA